MVRNALRNELAELLAVTPGNRTPAIRRSLHDDWLYATDLPGLHHGSIPQALQEALAGAGWEYMQEGDWLLLRKPAPAPPENWFAGTFGPEAACCLSLLDRHGDPYGEPADAVQRRLIKAGEEGVKAYEDACRAIHREWAEHLRQGKPLPAVSRQYFGG